MGEKGKRQRGLSVIHRLFLHLAGDDGADLLCIMGMCTMGTLATSSYLPVGHSDPTGRATAELIQSSHLERQERLVMIRTPVRAR